jgi:hypothetical protein
MVKNMASEERNEIMVYDVAKQYEDAECLSKINLYGLSRLPSVAVDGKLLACCTNPMTRQDLVNEGLNKIVNLWQDTACL